MKLLIDIQKAVLLAPRKFSKDVLIFICLIVKLAEIFETDHYLVCLFGFSYHLDEPL